MIDAYIGMRGGEKEKTAWRQVFDGLGIRYQTYKDYLKTHTDDRLLIEPAFYLEEQDLFFVALQDDWEDFRKGFYDNYLIAAKPTVAGMGTPIAMGMKLFCDSRIEAPNVQFAKDNVDGKVRLYVKNGYDRKHYYSCETGALVNIRELGDNKPIDRKTIFDTLDLTEPITFHYYERIPYEEKDLAKEYNARWDSHVKCWYFNSKEERDDWRNRKTEKGG